MLHLVGFINLLVWIAAAGVFFVRRRIPFYHPMTFYLVYHFLGFVARPFVASLPNANVVWDYIGFEPNVGNLLFSCLAANLALVSCCAGALMGSEGAPEQPFVKRSFQINRRGLFILAAVAFTAISMIATKMNGNFSVDPEPGWEIDIDDAGGQRLVGVSGYQTSIENFAVGLLVMMFMLWGVNALTLGMFAPWIFFRMFLGTGRWTFVLPMIIVGGISAWRTGRRWPGPKMIAAALALLLVFNILGGNREAFRMLVTHQTNLKDVLAEHKEQRGQDYGLSDFQEFEVSTFLYSVIPNRTGWNYGTQYLRVLTWPIPRQWWPEKPVYTARVNLNSLGNFFGLSLSLYADLYSILGLPALALCMGAIGFGLARLYTRAATTMNTYFLCAYWIILMECPQFFRDGGVTIVFFFTFIFLPIAACIWAGNIKVVDRNKTEGSLST